MDGFDYSKTLKIKKAQQELSVSDKFYLEASKLFNQFYFIKVFVGFQGFLNGSQFPRQKPLHCNLRKLKQVFLSYLLGGLFDEKSHKQI
mgnify:CR=1